MRTGDGIPKVTPDVVLGDGLLEMSQKGLGMTAVVDADDKIFILLVHGLASDPLTWLPMYATLMAHDTIRTRCQFAFWFYPTGQPILYSAYQLREALAV